MRRDQSKTVGKTGSTRSTLAANNRHKRFLEPVYLNEKMVLNCAAYLFGGVPIQSETNEGADQSQKVSASVGLIFLQGLLQGPRFEGERQTTSFHESRSAYRYTVGGLHMAVIDELRNQGMIQEASSQNSVASLGIGEAYVDVHCELRPSDYYSLLGTVKILSPLVSQVARDFGHAFLPSARQEGIGKDEFVASLNAYEKSIATLIERLENDYLTSKQLEMVLWTKQGQERPIGIVDLDVTDLEPSELRAKLSGGRYHVIGKVVGKVGAGESIDLLQKTILSNSVELFNKLLSFQTDQEQLAKFREQSSAIRRVLQEFVQLDIPGPAVRIAAMSVCI